MGLHQTLKAASVAGIAGMLAVHSVPAGARTLASGWAVAPVEAPLGEKRSCAVTKMTGSNRGIGFTRTSSGLELLTVAVEGWAYPLGEQLSETVKIGDGTPMVMPAFGQNDATLAKGMFSSNKILRTASSLRVAIGQKEESFDIAGLDGAFDALAACVQEPT